MRKLKALGALLPLTAGLLVAAMVAEPAGASHSWGTYHWAIAAKPFTIQLGDSVSAVWDSHLATASEDWTRASVLDTTVPPGNGTNAKRCVPTSGTVEVCNTTYGRTGWLGIATIWASGSHITKGSVKNNDTYFNTAQYDTPAWRQFVMCQEIGHTFGLGHVNETFTDTNTGSCMDYTNNPKPSADPTVDNTDPNQHDFDMLSSIYNHIDETSTIAQPSVNGAAAAGGGNSQADWGQAIRYSTDGQPILFEQDLGNGQRIFTFVIWAEGSPRDRGHD